ncbi:MAG: translocation/assembly module TamB domain-containing protein [Dechloromonas sp.]|nr:translocation/assembly module TamB domain-containing protein [Dechloromonas sp.]
MKRLIFIIPAVFLALVGVIVVWLGFTESGLATIVRVASSGSTGRLTIDKPVGHLFAGELAFERLIWKEPDREIVVDDLRIDWSPASLLQGRLNIATISATQVLIDITTTDEESAPPASLRLPVAVDVRKMAISRLDFARLFAVENVRTAYVNDRATHRLEQLSGRIGKGEISGNATLGADAPFTLEVRARLAGQMEGKAVSLAVETAGPLDRIALKVTAAEGLRGDGRATLTPFARRPFAAAQLALTDVDPAAWIAGSPGARLAVLARASPDASAPGALSGDFSVINDVAGPLDRQRLPLASLAGRFAWHADGAQLAELTARLPGHGTLAGSGRWENGQLNLDLTARAVDAAQVAAVLRSTRLNGPISASIGRDRQTVKVRLADAGFVLTADAGHENGKVSVPRFELAAGKALLRANGELQINKDRSFSTNGELVRFDPSKFARVPAALINATLSAAGSLQPEAVVQARFALRDSRLAGQPLSGHGDLVIDWPRIPKADVQLAAGPNHLNAHGAFGRPGDSLIMAIDAPALGPYGLEGSLAGQLQLGGTADQPTLAAELGTPRVGLPGVGTISGARVLAEIASAPGSPLKVDASVAALDGAKWPGLVRQLYLRVTGTRRQHSLKFAGEVGGKNLLELAAEGGFADDVRQPRWSGRLLEARLAAEQKMRSFVLAQPVALGASRDAWQIGPAVLDGDAWQIRLRADAGRQRVRAELSGRGPRIGDVSGNFEAAMVDAWTLNRQGPWLGAARIDVADLGWVAEWLDGLWKSSGRLSGELKLAGIPDRPLVSGQMRGEKLALSIPEQGMQLANGILEATVSDNLLRITQLAFDSVLQAPPRALRRTDSEALEQLVAKPGRLEITGEMRVDRSSGSDSAALDLRLDRVGIYQLPDQWLTVSGDGRISWIKDVLGIKGKLAADAAYWKLVDIGTPRLSDDVVIMTSAGTREAAAYRPRLDLDLEADAGGNFQFRGFGLSARLAGNIRVQAQGRDLPRASGRIRARDGRFDAYGQQLEIERGVLTFQGLLENPALDVRAVRKNLPVEAGVQITGTVQKPVARLISDPELPDVEKLSWLVLGHGPDQTGAGDAVVLLSAAGSLLGNQSGGVVQQIKSGFGIDEFGVRQGQIGDLGGRQPGSRVGGGAFDATSTTGNQILSVGKRLSNNALLSYDQTLGKAESVVKLTIFLNRQLSLIARAGSDNALDIFYTISFGGPLPRAARDRSAK